MCQGTGKSPEVKAALPKFLTLTANLAQPVNNGPSLLVGYFLDNTGNSSVTYFIFYNAAAANVVPGSTAPYFSLAIPAGQAANVWLGGDGIDFVSPAGISVAAGTTANGGTAPTVVPTATIFYKPVGINPKA